MLDDFISNVITITTSCFGGTKPIQLVGGHFKRSDIQKDYGVFLAQQKEDLQQQRIMVVRNLEDIPAQAAQAFHTICDTQEPLVDNAVIYLTLDMSRVRNVYELTEESAMSEAERSLRALWKNSLPPEVLESLITRLTENVYRIV
uniref:Uncharacterized protein n=1 Tax=Anopheles christyi TaxID=43041 RepID=A0A182K3I7_9DIPT